jgi:hypothetical protein
LNRCSLLETKRLNRLEEFGSESEFSKCSHRVDVLKPY